jgi:acetyl esterase/lipase
VIGVAHGWPCSPGSASHCVLTLSRNQILWERARMRSRDDGRWFWKDFFRGTRLDNRYARSGEAPRVSPPLVATLMVSFGPPLRDEGRAEGEQAGATGVGVASLDFDGMIHVQLRLQSILKLTASTKEHP